MAPPRAGPFLSPPSLPCFAPFLVYWEEQRGCVHVVTRLFPAFAAGAAALLHFPLLVVNRGALSHHLFPSSLPSPQT